MFGSLPLLALVLIPLLQVPAVLYLSRHVELDDEGEGLPDLPTGYATSPDERAGDADAVETPGAVACSRCGAPNDTGFTYCRDCVTRLA